MTLALLGIELNEQLLVTLAVCGVVALAALIALVGIVLYGHARYWYWRRQQRRSR